MNSDVRASDQYREAETPDLVTVADERRQIGSTREGIRSRKTRTLLAPVRPRRGRQNQPEETLASVLGPPHNCCELTYLDPSQRVRGTTHELANSEAQASEVEVRRVRRNQPQTGMTVHAIQEPIARCVQ